MSLLPLPPRGPKTDHSQRNSRLKGRMFQRNRVGVRPYSGLIQGFVGLPRKRRNFFQAK
jgi:hypothetical protein